MADYTREIRRRHTSIDRHRDFELFCPEFDHSLKLRQVINSVLADEMDLTTARESIRRNYLRPVRGVGMLLQRIEDVELHFPMRLYKAVEVLQAAAVASCDLMERNKISLRLAEAAAKVEIWERTRQAIAEAMEGFQILRLFFVDDESLIAPIEEDLKTAWKSEQSFHKGLLDIFDSASDNPSNEWIDLILWNSDTDVENQLVGQCDATIRLAIRFDHWLNQLKRPLRPVILEMYEKCESGRTETIDPGRCLLTIADALMEVRQWQLAAGLHERIQEFIHQQPILRAHAGIQSGYCYLQLSNLESCGRTLCGIDPSFLNDPAMSDRVAIGELARYTSIYSQYQERSGRPASPGARKHIQYLMKKASSLVSWRQGSENRSAHLRNLYYSTLVRDVLSHRQGRLGSSTPNDLEIK